MNDKLDDEYRSKPVSRLLALEDGVKIVDVGANTVEGDPPEQNPASVMSLA